MKKIKPSNILLLSIGAAFFASAILSESVTAAPSTNYNRSVREMMARRRGETVGLKKTTERPAPYAVKSNKGSQKYASSAPSYTTPSFSLFGYEGDRDGSLFPGGSCSSCHDSGPIFDTGPCERCYDNGPIFDTGPCEKCEEPVEEVVVAEPAPVPVCPVCVAPKLTNYAISYNDYVVQALARNCCAMAPLYLEHVDFNLKTSSLTPNKMGNYRFRIFGCRRYSKEAVLNQGRVMEKDMKFNQIFESVTGDCYNIIKKPDDLCLQKTPSPLPEYILTAEITDFFMNVCDGYDWEGVKKTDQRTGSSEIKVVWKLSNLSKTKVLWEGETTGYAELTMGDKDGEIALVEAAFADAVSNLQTERGFENQLMVRLTPAELAAERRALIDEEIALDPVKCNYHEELKQVKQCELTRPEVNITQCPAITQNCGVITDYKVLDNCIDEFGGVIVGGDCAVVDDTWVETDAKAFDSFCIVDRPPYDVLTPENLYKVRASVVEISNNLGKKGAGLIVSDSFILTSANLVDKQDNVYKIRTINGKEFLAKAVRVNPSKNTALLMLSNPTEYTPLSLNLDLPKVGETGFMTLGMLDVDTFDNGSENYLSTDGKILGYRYSDDKGSEIIVDSNVQDVTIGGVLIDSHGTINGIAHTNLKTENGKDLFLPTETALRSLGLSICEKVYATPSPWQQTVYKPVTELIMQAPKAPEEMPVKDRK